MLPPLPHVPPPGAGTRRSVMAQCARVCGLALLLVGHAVAVPPARLDPEAIATDPPEPSIWSYIESAEGGAPAPAVVEATEELLAERMAEIGFSGLVGAEPPIEYYLDPVGATDRDPLHLDRLDPTEFDIPVIVNDPVRKWMVYFLGPGRKYYTRYLERSTRWLPLMTRELDARGLPHDLVYLSMIESGFSTGATSYASAAGLWQFMPYTGKDYGLRIDWWVDERRDPEASTKAALRYLSDLNKMFAGDWWLSWASYNGGQGRVMKATRRYGSADFWKIAAGDYLHQETENYVPKLLAAAIIGKHPERYGFIGLKYLPEFTFETVDAPASSSVAVLAKCAGIGVEEFLEYNPALRRFALPPDPEVQKIRVPVGASVAFLEALAKVPPEERLTLKRHVVKRGESLAGIARKYKVTVADIAKVNRIGNVNRVSVGMELVIPMNGQEPAAVAEAAGAGDPKPVVKAETPPETAPVKSVTHKVRSGETLSGIAAKYGVSTSDIQSWNKLRGSKILVGQKLVVKGGTAAPAPKASASKAPASKAPASTAAAPAKAAKAAKTTTYTVRRGDTLSGIADRYGCSVSDLKAWNGLRGATIYAGQKLKIKG